MELLLARVGHQPAIAIPLCPLELCEIDGDILLPYAKETADADHDCLDPTILANDDVVDVADA